MALSFSKIDKLLELFSSSEDEFLDKIIIENNSPIEKEKIENVPEQVFENDNSYQKQNCIKNIINNKWETKSSKDVPNKSNQDVKVVELEVKPIMIKDSDSECDRFNINKNNNTKPKNINFTNITNVYKESAKKKNKRLRKRKRQKLKELGCDSDESNCQANEKLNKDFVVQLENTNTLKTARIRKNRAQVKRNLKCKQCNQRMKNEQLFMLHTQIHDNRKETECILCNKDFENVNAVLEHYASFDKNRQDQHYLKLRPFPCHLCDLRYKNRKHLTDHLDIHAGQGKYLCPICGKRFFKSFNMTIHLKVHEKSYHSCEHCSKNFRNIREYQAHQRNVHGENNITCPICNRAFSRRNNMKKHMETHGKIYNQCIICNINFKFRREYNQHMRDIHNRVKKYTCSVCDKVFSLHCKLTRHLETHNRIKDSCTICDKEFRNHRDFNAHMRNMHGLIIGFPNTHLDSTENQTQCKMQFKIIHDVQVSPSVDAESGLINENDVKINIKININDTNENFDEYYF